MKHNSWSALLLAGLLVSLPLATIPVAAQPAEATNSSANTEVQFTQQILGQWEVTFPSINGSEEVTQIFVLASEGQFFDLSPTNGQIIQFPWWIDYYEQTPVLIVNAGNVLLAGALTGSDTMIMRLVPLDSTTEDAEFIRSVNLNARKLSANVTLPADRTVISGEEYFRQQARLARQSQAKITIGTINRAQQAYILEYEEFASSDEFPAPLLGEGVIDSEHYTYEVRRSDTGDVAYAIASPNAEGWPSFIGIVMQQAEGTISQQIVCESKEPTRQAPSIVLPDISGNLTCPTGYE